METRGEYLLQHPVQLGVVSLIAAELRIIVCLLCFVEFKATLGDAVTEKTDHEGAEVAHIPVFFFDSLCDSHGFSPFFYA